MDKYVIMSELENKIEEFIKASEDLERAEEAKKDKIEQAEKKIMKFASDMERIVTLAYQNGINSLHGNIEINESVFKVGLERADRFMRNVPENSNCVAISVCISDNKGRISGRNITKIDKSSLLIPDLELIMDSINSLEKAVIACTVLDYIESNEEEFLRKITDSTSHMIDREISVKQKEIEIINSKLDWEV